MNTKTVTIIDEEKKLTLADLEKTAKYLANYSCGPGSFTELIPELIPKQRPTCMECPFRFTLHGISDFARGGHEAIEHHITNLGGFPCHMIDGNEKAFSPTEETKHQCKGWLNAGGDLPAFQRRYQRPPPYIIPQETNIFEYLKRAGCA